MGFEVAAAHIPGTENSDADWASRSVHTNIEFHWDPAVFKLICQRHKYTADADLFASHSTTQLPTFVSCGPDPHAVSCDAFTLDWGSWSPWFPWVFPSFSVLLRVCKKIFRDKATVLALFPFWPNQVWFPQVALLLVSVPLALPVPPLLLLPSLEPHPLRYLQLIYAVLSGKPYLREGFLRRLWKEPCKGSLQL